MSRSPVDVFAGALSAERRDAVRSGAEAGHHARSLALHRDLAEPDPLRSLAGGIKQHVLDHLDHYLEAAAARLEENGVAVHFAADAAAARDLVAGVIRRRGVRRVVKSKTMLGEEVELAAHLEALGVECVETDLGELVVQLDGDRPSHIVKPILHKNRQEVAAILEDNGLGPYDDRPEVITRRARGFLRKKYLEADCAVSGANFVSAESGRVVIVTNEGNSRFALAATRCHVVLCGIEKIVPRDRDLAVFLCLLARSATGQSLSAYTEFLSGPRGAGQEDGPDEMHVVFVDNGRSEVLAGDCREILRCIRCGACMNVCPVYRQASGHAYRGVYPGPLGAVLAPLLAGSHFSEWSDLPFASTLCGACHEVCPVDIPLDDLLLRLRERARRSRAPTGGTPSLAGWSFVASDGGAWRAALVAGGVLERLPAWLTPAPVAGWSQTHDLPAWRGGAFRAWLAGREVSGA